MSEAPRRRLQKVAVSLTPTQVACLLLEEFHTFPSLMAYVASLRGKPIAEYPLDRATRMAENAVTNAVRGLDRDRQDQAIRQARRDSLFLMRLHHEVNVAALQKLEDCHQRYQWLLDSLRALFALDRADRAQRARWREVSAAWPYPLDHETAAAIQAALAGQVLSWSGLEELGQALDWVTAACEADGATALPFGVYLARDRPGQQPGVPRVPSLDEVRTLFAETAAWDAFRTGSDYNCGLADVSDAVVEGRTDAVMTALQALTAEGTVAAGQVLRLECVPMPFLRDVPALDGGWVDRLVLELAEWGTLLLQAGFRLSEPADDHPFAWSRILDAAGDEVSSAVTMRPRQQASKHLDRFPGRTRAIAGRPYLSLADYARWKGRLLKGPLPEFEPGLVIGSFNAWVAANGGEGVAALAGVPVDAFFVYGGDAHVIAADPVVAREQHLARTTVLTTLHAPATDRAEYAERARDWQDRATWLLADLVTQQVVHETLSRRYFAGTSVLFPDDATLLADMLGSTTRLISLFNEVVAAPLERDRADEEPPFAVDAAAVEASRGPQVQVVLEFTVDRARSKTLDDLGDSRGAQELLERHVWTP